MIYDNIGTVILSLKVLYHNGNGTTTLYDTHVVKLGSSEIFNELQV